MEVARDLTAETFAEAFEHRRRVRGSSEAEAEAAAWPFGIARHQLSRYADGAPLEETGVDGGFVLLVDASGPLRELVAYDVAGRELERVDVRYLDLRYYCEKDTGCPPLTGPPAVCEGGPCPHDSSLPHSSPRSPSQLPPEERLRGTTG